MRGGFEKAGLFCKTFARFSAGGIFSRLACWSVKKRKTFIIYTVFEVHNNTSEYHYDATMKSIDE